MGYQEEELARLNAQNRLNQNTAGTGANLNISGISDTTDTELKRINQGYQQGQNVLQAKQQLDNIIAGKPGDYKSSYTDNLNNLYNSIMNRGNFQYDPTADALYQNYKNLYQQNGQKAMRDTNAQAAAMTGGYGNSYAAAAGNQAYQGYMQQLNAAIPQLEQQAYQRWQDEGNELYNRMNLTQGMDDREYGRWGDQYNRWYNERGYYDQAYNTERDRDYQKYINDANYWTGIADRENQNALQAQQMKDDAYNYALNLMQYGVMPDEGTLASAGLTPAMAEQIMKQIYAPAGGGAGGSLPTNVQAPAGWDKAKIEAFQKANGLTPDGVWGPYTQRKYNELYGTQGVPPEDKGDKKDDKDGKMTPGNLYDALLANERPQDCEEGKDVPQVCQGADRHRRNTS